MCHLFFLKKMKQTFLETYRPVSVQSTASKIFEQIKQKQIPDFIEQFFSIFIWTQKRI